MADSCCHTVCLLVPSAVMFITQSTNCTLTQPLHSMRQCFQTYTKYIQPPDTVCVCSHLADPDQALQHAYGGAGLAALLCLTLLLVVRHQHLRQPTTCQVDICIPCSLSRFCTAFVGAQYTRTLNPKTC